LRAIGSEKKIPYFQIWPHGMSTLKKEELSRKMKKLDNQKLPSQTLWDV
jgi:hypothetical protein